MTYELPDRQLEILRLVAQGMSGPEIARRLHITVDTVKTHLSSLYRSMGARNAPHAVAIAYQLNILQPRAEDCCRKHLAGWLAESAKRVRGE